MQLHVSLRGNIGMVNSSIQSYPVGLSNSLGVNGKQRGLVGRHGLASVKCCRTNVTNMTPLLTKLSVFSAFSQLISYFDFHSFHFC